MNKKIILSLIVVLVSIGAGYYLIHTRGSKLPTPPITSFQDCASAGYPIMQTYPQQCKTPDGRIFTNQTGQAQSGITGTVLLGPTCPVERIPPDPACADKLYQTTLVATTSDGSTVAQTFSSDTEGKFSVALPPGDYLIQSPITSNLYPRCSSRGAIQVAAGAFTKTTIYCDTGIR